MESGGPWTSINGNGAVTGKQEGRRRLHFMSIETLYNAVDGAGICAERAPMRWNRVRGAIVDAP